MELCIANVFPIITNKMQRYTIYFFCEMLYMLQAVPPPIMRVQNCIYRIEYFVKPLLLPATVVEEMELAGSITFTTVAGSSKGLTKYPMLYIQF